MRLTAVQLFFLIVTMLLGLLPGFLRAGKIKSADEYSVGGRSAGMGMVAGCIIATIVGGAATVGTAQMGFKIGLPAWWFTLGSGIAFLIMAYIYAEPLRESGLTTIAQYMEIKYGTKAGVLAGVSASMGIFFSIVASSLTAIHLISSIFGIDILVSVFIIVAVAGSIVYFGGLSGSSLTGIFKIGIIFITIFLGGVLAYVDMNHLGGMRAVITDDRYFSLFGHGLQNGIINLLSMIMGVVSTQSYIQAIFSAKDSETAKRGCIIAALVVIPIGLPSVIIGMFMSVHHPEINPIDALPMYLLNYLPESLGGIGIAGLLLSALGSIAGLAFGVSTMLTNGVIQKTFKNLSDESLLNVSRLNVLLVITGALIFTCFHLDSSVLEWNFLSMALRGSGIFMPLTFAVLVSEKITAARGFYAMLAGIITACLWNKLQIARIDSLLVSVFFSLLIFLPELIRIYKSKVPGSSKVMVSRNSDCITAQEDEIKK